MNDRVSPPIRKLLAVAILLVLLWICGASIIAIGKARLSLFQQTQAVQQAYGDVRSRRVDTVLLEQRLAALLASPTVQQAVVVADNDKAALAQAQQIVRKSVMGASGQLLSLTPAPNAGGQIVGLQMRVRLPESALAGWLHATEHGQPRLQIDEVSLRPLSPPAGSASDVEMTAVLTAPWLQRDGLTR